MTNIERPLCSRPLVYRWKRQRERAVMDKKPVDPDTFVVQVGEYLSMKVHKEGRQ